MKGDNNKTREQNVIRLLTLLADSQDAISSDETWLVSDLAILAELEAGNFISVGDIIRDGGQVVAIAHMTISSHGRMYLAELKRQAEAQTSIGLIKQNRFHFYRWFFGIVGTIIAGYIVWRLTH